MIFTLIWRHQDTINKLKHHPILVLFFTIVYKKITVLFLLTQSMYTSLHGGDIFNIRGCTLRI